MPSVYALRFKTIKACAAVGGPGLGVSKHMQGGEKHETIPV
jgi:hypothetical protein